MEQLDFQDRIERKKQLEEQLKALQEKRDDLESRERAMKQNLAYEESDVERMEGKNMTSLFYTLIGKKDEKLEQEYREADEAKAAYEAVVKELADTKKALNRTDYEIRQLKRSEKEERLAFEKSLEKLRARLDTLPPEVAKDLTVFEKNLAGMQEQQMRIFAAIEEGEKALYLAESVLEPLREAKEYDRLDCYYSERERIDEAMERQRMLQIQLERFSALLQAVDTRLHFELLRSDSDLCASALRMTLADLEEMLTEIREQQAKIKDRMAKCIEQYQNG